MTSAKAGILSLGVGEAELNLRLFDHGLAEYEMVLDSIPQPIALGSHEQLFKVWTPLYGVYANAIGLVHGDEASYSLTWERVVPTVGLDVLAPAWGVTWKRGEEQRIRWATPFDQMDVVLIKGPVMVAILKRDIEFSEELNWLPSAGLEPGNDYHIAVFWTGNPHRMGFSERFTIE